MTTCYLRNDERPVSLHRGGAAEHEEDGGALEVLHVRPCARATRGVRAAKRGREPAGRGERALRLLRTCRSRRRRRGARGGVVGRVVRRRGKLERWCTRRSRAPRWQSIRAEEEEARDALLPRAPPGADAGGRGGHAAAPEGCGAFLDVEHAPPLVDQAQVQSHRRRHRGVAGLTPEGAQRGEAAVAAAGLPVELPGCQRVSREVRLSEQAGVGLGEQEAGAQGVVQSVPQVVGQQRG
mmetsp:Transcript_28318/g.63249  ORF Transcript_28318/g.63249 Transcript_28318/m.63249 type:complete len:238 (+) Transcript_28318:209-922(+)